MSSGLLRASSRRVSRTSSILEQGIDRSKTIKHLMKGKPPSPIAPKKSTKAFPNRKMSRHRSSILMTSDLNFLQKRNEAEEEFNLHHKIKPDNELENDMKNFFIENNSNKSFGSSEGSFHSISDDNIPSSPHKSRSLLDVSNWEGSVDDRQNLETMAIKQMKEFYDSNFSLKQIKRGGNFLNSRVWAVKMDEVYDLAYVFRA